MNTRTVWYPVAGAGAGLLAGLLGVGGGIILVPVLVGLLGATQHNAHGISLAVIVPTALVSATVYALRGDVDWALVAAVGAGSVIGVIVGAKLMIRVPARSLRQAFGVYTIAVAIVLLVR